MAGKGLLNFNFINLEFRLNFVWTLEGFSLLNIHFDGLWGWYVAQYSHEFMDYTCWPEKQQQHKKISPLFYLREADRFHNAMAICVFIKKQTNKNIIIL